MGKTISEKILSKASCSDVKAGDTVIADIDMAMLHDSLGPMAVQAFGEMGFKKVLNPEKIVGVFDHLAPSPAETYSKMQAILRNFLIKENIKYFDIGNGICHQLLPEQGLIKPGQVVVGSDSHTCTYGALNVFATGVGSTEIAAVMGTGKLWFKVPQTIKVIVNGKMQKGVFAKDLVLHIIGKVTADGANYKAIEFTGGGIFDLSIESRLTVSNMVIEMGGKVGIMEIDDKAAQWLKLRDIFNIEPIFADDNATYFNEFTVNLSELSPQVSCPHTVDNVKTIEELIGKPVNQVVIGTCTNGRIEDFRIARQILKGNSIHKGVRVIIVPSSRKVLLDAIEEGIISDFVSAGCAVLTPGCGPCVGAHGGIPGDGDVVVSTSNRNFIGRMGNNKAFIYLASPATAMASAIAGEITDCRQYLEV